MKLVYISVEGQTEETFVREVLTPHLTTLTLTPILLKTNEADKSKKGGFPKYSVVQKQVQSLLKNSHAVAVTTMYDLYALPKDFPGVATKPKINSYDKAKYLERTFQEAINESRFRPYLQMHEFETFLFVDPEITAHELQLKANDLATIRRKFNSPEEINDDPTTCPSARILNLKPSYEKSLDGVIVTIAIGLETIRQSCPHFNEWLTWLESLG